MKRKKITAILAGLAAGALALSLSACGSSSGASSDSTIAAAASDTTSASADSGTVASPDGTTKVIRAVTGGSPKPYVYTDDDGNLTGFDIEVLQAIVDKLPGYELSVEQADFESLFSGLSAGTYDIAVNNLSYRPERAENYYFSYPYDAIQYDFIQRSDDTPLTSLEDASKRGYTIECGASENVTAALEDWNKNNPDYPINIVYTEADLGVRFEHIVDGAADFRIDDQPIFNSYLQDYGFDLQGTPLSDEEVAKISDSLEAYFLFPKTEDGKALRDEIDKALVEVRDDGTLKELSEKYFNADQVPDDSEYEKTVN